MTSKKSPNVYKSDPKMISREKGKILTRLKISKSLGDLGEKFDATGFEKLPKVQQIAQSGHTGCSQRWKRLRKTLLPGFFFYPFALPAPL